MNNSGLCGYSIPPYYDSLIAKLIVHGNNRNECILKVDKLSEKW